MYGSASDEASSGIGRKEVIGFVLLSLANGINISRISRKTFYPDQ
jgi:hypothetical protein